MGVTPAHVEGVGVIPVRLEGVGVAWARISLDTALLAKMVVLGLVVILGVTETPYCLCVWSGS